MPMPHDGLMQQCPLEPLRGWRRGNTITALRSLFRFATRLRIVFTNPTARLANPLRERCRSAGNQDARLLPCRANNVAQADP